MAYATKAFNVVQLGREATAGTAVPATKKWRGPAATFDDARERKIVEEDIGLLVPPELQYDLWELGRLALPQTDLSFEQICDLFEMGIETVTPVDNTGNYTYSYAFPTGSTLNTIKTYTVEAGNIQVPGDFHEMPFAYAEEIQLSGQAGEGWMMQANLVGQKLVQASPTGSIGLTNLTFAPFGKTKLYIDDSGGTIGNSQKSGTLMGAEIRIQTGIKYIPVGDGTLNYTAIKYGRPAVNFSLTIEVESGSLIAAERAAYKSNSIRLLRLQLNADANNLADIDMAVKYDTVSPYDEDDENVIVTLDGHAVYSSDDDLFFEAAVTNELDAL